MSIYTEVFVIPVPKHKIAEYQKVAETSAQVRREYGALSYVEFEADDVKPGQWTSFPQSVHLTDDEIVVVALVTYRSRAHRDEVTAKAMKDPRLSGMDPATLPFDAKRMFWGGFKPFVGGTPSQMNQIQPYLFFRGRCEEAIDYYKKTLSAEVDDMMRFRDNPDKPPCDVVPSDLDDKIMHATIRIAGAEMMMSDGMKSGPLNFECMSLSLALQSEEDPDRIFTALSGEGSIQMQMGPTFFAKKFGAVADKFGVSWMIFVPPGA